jgi:hypothetical protein
MPTETTYENQIIAYAKANPTIDVGMLVEIWNHDDPSHIFYCGVGRAKRVIWDVFLMSHIIEVEYFFDGMVRRYEVMEGCCDPYVGRNLRLI